jgi:hypothetical protein
MFQHQLSLSLSFAIAEVGMSFEWSAGESALAKKWQFAAPPALANAPLRIAVLFG